MTRHYLSSQTLRVKLIGSMMITATTVLVILGGYEWFDKNANFHDRVKDRLTALADVTAHNSESAVLFGDVRAAEVTLSALKAQKDIVRAVIYTPDKRIFAKYQSGKNVEENSQDLDEAVQSYAEQNAGFYFSKRNVYVVQPLLFDDEKIGVLVVSSSQEELAAQRQRGLLVGLVVGVFSLCIAYLMSIKFQDLITLPVRKLANTANAVGISGDYSLRSEKITSDEIGRLADQFNAMLAQVENRDKILGEQLKLRTAERTFLQNIIDAVDDTIMVVSPDYSIDLMNRSAQKQITFDHRSGIPCYQLRYGYDQPCHLVGQQCPMLDMTKDMRSVVLDRTLSTVNGFQYLEVSASPLLDGENKFIGMVEAVKDITSRKQAEASLIENKEHLDYLAHHDFLTELPNRMMLQEHLLHAIYRSKRSGDIFALLFLDLDRFKNVNDTFGHETGDQLLQAAARRIQKTLRESDLVSRLGGDEFAVLLESIESKEVAAHIANKIVEAIEAPFVINGHEFFIGVSIGISIFPEDGEDLESLTKHADSAMYQAKASGRGNFQFYIMGTNEKIHRSVAIEQNLRKALDREEIYVAYQPQILLSEGRIVSAEALLRWESHELGFVSPAEFIPIAEESGLIIPIGEWVLQTAFQQLAAWDAKGLPAISIGVNLSPRQFWQQSLIDMIQACLNRSGVSAERVDIELTEGMVLKDTVGAIQLMNKLREIGLRISIDDFGTGYSSLSYLHRLPINNLKIAQEFVRGIPKNVNSTIIAKAIVMLAKNLNLKIIAEGVEADQQLDFFRNLDCEMVQGYYFGRPVAAAEFEKTLSHSLMPDVDRSPG